MELTDKQLQTLIATAVSAAVSESRKPAPLNEEQQAIVDQAKQMRIDQGALTLQEIKNRKYTQSVCSHTRGDGTCNAVYVENGNYIICQTNQCVIRPGVAPKDDDGRSIYDTQLFNRLFQLCNRPAIF